MTANEIISRCEKLASSARQNWEALVQLCMDYCLPKQSQVNKTVASGQKRVSHIYDSTAIVAAERLANGMYTHMNPPTRRWFELTPRNKNNEEVNRWFSQITTITYEELAASNFALQAHETYNSLAIAGTGFLSLMPGVDTALNFRAYHFSTCYISEGPAGTIDTIYLKYQRTARVIKALFPEGTLSSKILDAAEDEKKCDDLHWIIHAIYPRKDRDSSKVDNLNMPYASTYVEVDSKSIIEKGGFEEFPFMIPRFSKDMLELEGYGRSPAMGIIDEVLMLNAMKLTTIKAAQKRVDPPILVPDDGSMNQINTAPSSQIFFQAGATQAEPKYLEFGGDIAVTFEMIDRQREIVKQAFYEDFFTLFMNIQDQGDRTAYESQRLEDEKIAIFAPTIGRLQSEWFDPMITRAVGILQRGGYYPDPPFNIENDAEYQIEYKGKMAILLSAMDLNSLQTSLEALIPLSEVFPGMLDWINSDEAARFILEKRGVPSKLINPKNRVDETRQVRQAQQQAIQAAEIAAEAGKAKAFNQAPVAGSPMEKVMSGV